MSTSLWSAYFILLSSSLITWNFVSCLPCKERSYGQDSIVCVCNETYCDDLQPIDLFTGQVVIVESNRAGKRFEKSRLNLSESSNDTNQLFDHYVDVQVDQSLVYQSVIGFGGAFTDSTTINIRTLSDKLQKRLYMDYFSKSGLEYNLGRVPIGGTDFSSHPYAYDPFENDFNLTRFALTSEDYDYKIPAIKEAQSLSEGKLLLFASAWSPPGWMKTTGKVGTSGRLKGPVCGQYYQTWANYYVKFLNEYKRNGLNFWGLTTGNEPSGGLVPYYGFNALGFTPSTLTDFIKCALGPALEKAGYGKDKLQLIAGDDQTPVTLFYARSIAADKEAAKYVSGYGIHWYYNNWLTWPLIDQIKKLSPESFLLSTEACIGPPQTFIKPVVRLGNWNRGEEYAKDIVQDLKRSVSGWVDWNMALDLEGGPSWAKNYVDSPIIVNQTANEYYKNPMFYVLGHFSKFLVKESKRIQTKVKHSYFVQSDAVAFKRPDNRTVVIVYNLSDKVCQLTVREKNNSPVVTSILNPHSILTIIW